MRSLTAPLLAASAISAAAHALPELSISKRDKHNGGATNHFARSLRAHHHLERRQDTLGTNIFNVLSWSNGGAYYANLTVGTPPQEQTVIVDTGSADLYFDASNAPTCQTTGDTACKGGTFDKTASSTYEEYDPSPAFNTSFGDGSTALGPYGLDVVGIGNLAISPVQFGIAEEVSSTTGFALGLLGLGYSAIEGVRRERDAYQNMPEVLKDAGIINSRLYSVFLNDATADTGTILFGGIDRSKYTGDMATVNFLPAVFNDRTSEIVDQFITTVTAASAEVDGNNQTFWTNGSPGFEAYHRSDPALPVLLDTGSTSWSIPRAHFQPIRQAFSYIDPDGFTPCSNRHRPDALYLEFAARITIKIEASQFIVPLIDATTREPVVYDEAGSETCVFLLEEAEVETRPMAFQTMGDGILRSMYLVFDLENGQASIAQAAVNSTAESDVVVVEAGSDGVARAVGRGSTTVVGEVEGNPWEIAPEVLVGTRAFVVSTAERTLGAATGEAAVPADARVEDGRGTSMGAAAGFLVPKADFTGFWVAGVWMLGMVVGVGIMA